MASTSYAIITNQALSAGNSIGNYAALQATTIQLVSLNAKIVTATISAWSASTEYQPNSRVSYAGKVWKCDQSNAGIVPTTGANRGWYECLDMGTIKVQFAPTTYTAASAAAAVDSVQVWKTLTIPVVAKSAYTYYVNTDAFCSPGFNAYIWVDQQNIDANALPTLSVTLTQVNIT